MHPLPRRTLRRLIKQYGPTLLDDPARVDALLADHCGRYRAERFVLVYALRERISVADSSDTYWRRICSRRLQSRYCFSSEAAQWAAESWSFALKIDPPEPINSRDGGDSLDGLHGELSDYPRHALSKLLTEYGFDLLSDPERVNALLADLSGEFGRERFLLVHALREGIPSDLLAQKRMSAARVRRLTRRLQKRYGFSGKAAQWAVESWSAALNQAASAAASRPQGAKRTNLIKVLGQLSFRLLMLLGLLVIGVVALVFTWQSAIEVADRGAAWLASIPGTVEKELSQFVDHFVRPVITWVVGLPGLIALGTVTGLATIKALGLKRVWRGVTWLIGTTWSGMGKVWGRLSHRQKMWLALGFIGIVVLSYTWQSLFVYAEWGVAWLQSVPKLIDEILTHFAVHVVLPAIAWLVGIPGLIALGAISGLLTVRLVGLRRAWIGFTWPIRITWLGLRKVGKGFVWLIGITWLGLRKVGKGFAWLIGITWLGLGKAGKGSVWLTGVTWLGLRKVGKGFAWLIGITWLGLGKAGKGFAWLIGVTWLGLRKLAKGLSWLTKITGMGLGKALDQLSFRQQVWLGLGVTAILALGLMWQDALAYAEWGIALVLSTSRSIEGRFSQIVDYVSKTEIERSVTIPGLIALGAISGLLTLKSLGFGKVLSRLSLPQQIWLGLSLTAILALGLMWQGATMYAERGIAWLLSTLDSIERRLSQIVDYVSVSQIEGLAGIQGLIALGAVFGLLTIIFIASGRERIRRGIALLMRLKR